MLKGKQGFPSAQPYSSSVGDHQQIPSVDCFCFFALLRDASFSLYEKPQSSLEQAKMPETIYEPERAEGTPQAVF